MLSKSEIWSSDVIIVDTSVPGATAGSALMALIKQVLKSPFAKKIVIISLGNCDRINRPYLSNRPSLIKIFWNLILSMLPFQYKVKRLWVKLSPNEWIENTNQLKHQNKNDFAIALSWIKKICDFFKIFVIAIVPRSNIRFFPGTAQNNTRFFYLVGDEQNSGFSSPQAIPELDLIEDMIKSDFLDDNAFYRHVTQIAQYSTEKVICSVNNLAVKWAHEGKFYEAIELFRFLIKYSDYRHDILYFNLANIEALNGERENYQGFLNIALSKDTGSYRVDDEYSQTFRTIFTEKSKAKIIDLYDDSFDSAYLDHCHLLPDGQELVYTKIRSLVDNGPFAGNQLAVLSFQWTNPEALEGDTRVFSNFFGIESQNGSRESKNRSESDLLDLLGDSLTYCKIPSTRFSDLTTSVLFHESAKRFNCDENDILNASLKKEYARVDKLIWQLSLDFDLKAFSLVSEKANHQILGLHALAIDNIESFLDMQTSSRERLKSIMTWYFKESLYFGFNSSINMCFDRNIVRVTREIIGIAKCIAIANNLGFNDPLEKVVNFIDSLEDHLISFYGEHLEEIFSGKVVAEEQLVFKRLKEEWDRVKNEA